MFERLTSTPRAVGWVVLGCGALLAAFFAFATSRAPGSGMGKVAIAAALPLLGAAVCAALFRAIAAHRARAALSGPLCRVEATVASVQRPGSDGGPTRVQVGLQLPDGRDARATINTYHLDVATGAAVALWVATQTRMCFVAEPQVRCDPAAISIDPASKPRSDDA